MFYYTSFYRHRDNNGKIIGYTLRNEQTFEFMQVTPEQLKDAMYHKRVHIFNLKLTSDGRIVEAANPLQTHVGKDARLNTENQYLSSVKITGENDNLDYSESMSRQHNLERRVKFDGPFELNKIIRIFTGRRQNRYNRASGWGEENDPDGDGIIGDGGSDGGDYGCSGCGEF